jgi:hypothetical protein
MTAPSLAEQFAWMKAMRPETARIDFVFNNGDRLHPLLELLAHLDSVRTIGVGPGYGHYGRGRPTAVKRSYAYDRDIVRAIESLGGFFPEATSREQWTGLGDVDVAFFDKRGRLLGATVTHEGMLIEPTDEDDQTRWS